KQSRREDTHVVRLLRIEIGIAASNRKHPRQTRCNRWRVTPFHTFPLHFTGYKIDAAPPLQKNVSQRSCQPTRGSEDEDSHREISDSGVHQLARHSSSFTPLEAQTREQNAHQQVLPPSITKFEPVIYEDASEQRNRIAP